MKHPDSEGSVRLHPTLRASTRRQFPTATTVLVHHRLTRTRAGALQEHTVVAGLDAQGRTLFPLRPEELPEWQDAVTAQHGGGFLSLAL